MAYTGGRGKQVFVVGSICLVVCVGLFAAGVVLVLKSYHPDEVSVKWFTCGLLLIVFASIGILALCIGWRLKTQHVQPQISIIDSRALMDVAYEPGKVRLS